MRLLFLATLLLAVLAKPAWRGYKQWQHEVYLSSALPLVAPVSLRIAPGLNLAETARQLAQAGVIANPRSFISAVEHEGLDRKIQAGQYTPTPGLTVASLMSIMVSGQAIQEQFTIVEGRTVTQVRVAMAANPKLKSTLPIEVAEKILLVKLGAPEKHLEGLLFPDTYAFHAGDSDLALLRQAYQKMIRTLTAEWETRDPQLPYDNQPYQALIMASLIEKEAGNNMEMPLIASVFVNRLRRNMLLQSDPTVIYGMGSDFDGNLRRADLHNDHAHNTYTRKGLPPTPIALPGLAALEAALHPATSEYLYFVADGSGGHYFSRTLREHNNAVNRYQRAGRSRKKRNKQ